MKDKFRVGIIGCGGISEKKHFPALSKLNDEVDIVYFCDIIEERAQNACKDFGTTGAKVCTDYRKLLEDKSIDIVYVLTPNVSHSIITCDSLNVGKHVLCEKPMSHSYAEAQKMYETAKKTGKKLTIGYQNRFRKDSRELYEISRNGELGDIYFAKAHAIRRKAVPTWGVFPDKSQQGGGPLIDIGTHALDLALWFMNNYEPEMISGQVFQKLKDYPDGNSFGPWDPVTFETEDSAFGFIKMKNGATIFLEASWALNILNGKEACVTLCGTLAGAEMFGHVSRNEGYIVMNKIAHGVQLSVQPTTEAQVYGLHGDIPGTPGDLEARNWIDSIKNNTSPLVKPEEALVVTRILESIYISADTGKSVYL